MKAHNLISSYTLAVLTLLAVVIDRPWSARASVTLEIYFENGEIPPGSLAAVVADKDGDGFLPLTDPQVSGSILSLGQTIGDGDDTIIALFSSVAGPEWFSGSGLADTLPSLDYSALGIAEGTPLIIYVFPGLSTEGARFILGDEFITYRNSEIGGSGGDVPFEAPANPGVYTVAALTGGNGGTFDPDNPGTGETYLTGHTGTTWPGAADDHGNSRTGATTLTGNLSGDLIMGDLDFFEFEFSQAALLSTSLGGDVLAVAYLFDEFGNVVYAPPSSGGGPFSFNQLLEAGKYFLVVKGADDSEEGSYILHYASTLPPSLLPGVPDITIGPSPGMQIGNDLYTPGVGQQYKSKTSAGKKIRAYLGVGVDGGSGISVGLRGPRGNRFFKTKYISLSGGGNVTGAVGRGGFSTHYAAGSNELFRIDLKPSKIGKQKAKGGKFDFDAVGNGRLDRARLKAKVSKK